VVTCFSSPRVDGLLVGRRQLVSGSVSKAAVRISDASWSRLRAWTFLMWSAVVGRDVKRPAKVPHPLERGHFL